MSSEKNKQNGGASDVPEQSGMTDLSEESDRSDPADSSEATNPSDHSDSSEETSTSTVAPILEMGFGQTVPFVADEEEPEIVESEIEDETATIERMPEMPAYQSPSEVKAAIECLLFTTTQPLGIRKLRNLLGGIDVKTLRGIVSQLQIEYDARKGGLQIIESAEGFQMCTRPDYAEVVLSLHHQRKKNPITMTALETIAIIAYKQPITRAEIEAIRGVETSGVLRNLCDMGLVRVVGRKEVIGRPQLYGTTSLFLTTFGLRSLSELPTIQALRRQFTDKPKFDLGAKNTLDDNPVDEDNRGVAQDAIAPADGEAPDSAVPAETPRGERAPETDSETAQSGEGAVDTPDAAVKVLEKQDEEEDEGFKPDFIPESPAKEETIMSKKRDEDDFEEDLDEAEDFDDDEDLDEDDDYDDEEDEDDDFDEEDEDLDDDEDIDEDEDEDEDEDFDEDDDYDEDDEEDDDEDDDEEGDWEEDEDDWEEDDEEDDDDEDDR
jgi:segregation and condensation protein B